MDFTALFEKAMKDMETATAPMQSALDRLRAEARFARQFVDLFPDQKSEWEPLVLKAVETVRDGLAAGRAAEEVVAEAEEMLSPIGKAAKEYVVHCCGHAHIDMNWMWPWQETVNVTRDTFTTVDRLMDEFPEFKFSQSQASTYLAMEEYSPEIFEMIQRRIAEGRWEPVASTWVEGSKNLASGEILCRHLLYTREYLKEKFGLPYDTVKVDWSPDTFGHAWTLPSILNRGGVTRYYHCRTGPNYWLCRWRSPDGSEVLLFLDKTWYNDIIAPERITLGLMDYVRETGLKDFLFVYGVGDHGGGPTRKDLVKAREMSSWPIYPKIVMSTTDAYFSAVEAANPDLPVHDGELNFVFEGCYTSESSIKHANRVSENILPEVESAAVIAGLAGLPYPGEMIRKGWRMAMFNQFHDILPGSGVRATYEYAQGLFQEIQAITDSVRTRALRRLASKIDTAAATGVEPPSGDAGSSVGDGIGAGVGYDRIPGGITARNAGAVTAEPVVIFNQLAVPRSGVVQAEVWNKEIPTDRVIVRDDAGNTAAGQVIAFGEYWGHKHTTVVFPAVSVPGMGYRTYTIDEHPTSTVAPRRDNQLGYQGCGEMIQSSDYLTHPDEVTMPSPNVMENGFLRVEVDVSSGAIKRLIDKSTGYDLVPEGELLGALELCREAPHGMSAWEIGQFLSVDRLTAGGFLIDKGMGYDLPPQGGADVFPPKEYIRNGPHRAEVKVGRKFGSSQVITEIGLNAGSRQVDIRILADWREIGTRTTGVPTLRIAFPVRVENPKATYEIPFGNIERPTNGREVPALRWADLSGEGEKGAFGITLLNADKYGHSADGNTLRLTLLRSSCDPDPLPEIGDHDIRLAVVAHSGHCSPTEATLAASAFSLPMSVVSTDVHHGDLPGSKGFAEVLTPNVALTALKKAEGSNSVVVRLYEMEGRDTEARVRISDIVRPDALTWEVDLMECPLQGSTTKMEGGVLSVRIPAHGIATVMLG